mmetsp:Transcript_8520/g.13324  ORF Transcript_8520/g.13324 Transcript_8520/m.13324 type:complete len:479 (+) Transcript_8520:257-1693(+)|eukprot:CAMPEP_0194248676 /NCGR_PEP_ID=MMETSP0158-20130606/18888_1 /TAXON_ID=33649 /ORGANISM="Thalassionema nitzschioides, Strain L26-B" /LENGTH=478 /DNA_ID=CAMNT_0038985035 /DNA_START=199 /DNA_END=1635 /DNA_ORIENTATION=-
MDHFNSEYRSPISVASNKFDFSKNISSKVLMGEHGAEVTLLRTISEGSLDRYSSPRQEKKIVVTPESERFIRSNLPTNSLLDDEATPSPRKVPRDRTPQINLWCTSTNALSCYKYDDQDSAILTTNAAIEKTLNKLLSSPTGVNDWCTSWQAWTYNEMDDSEKECTLGHRNDIRRVMRNRASNVGNRRARIRSLKQNLSPFDATPGPESIPVAKATSFCISDNPTVSQSPKSNIKLTCMMGACIEPEHDSPLVLRSRELDEGLYYDSDPEENTKRGSQKKNGYTTRGSSIVNKGLYEGIKSPFYRGELNLSNAKQVRGRVQEILNQRYTFIWHPNDANGKPVAVTAWFERGQHLCKKFVQPCFAWKKQNDNLSESTSKINIPDYQFHSIDLLDISRILEVNKVNRKKYPFAQRKKCFLIQGLENKMLFEASHEKERDRICQDFKLVVARLGSKVIMEDTEMFTEFFIVDGSVPGEAPI